MLRNKFNAYSYVQPPDAIVKYEKKIAWRNILFLKYLKMLSVFGPENEPKKKKNPIVVPPGIIVSQLFDFLNL